MNQIKGLAILSVKNSNYINIVFICKLKLTVLFPIRKCIIKFTRAVLIFVFKEITRRAISLLQY